MKVRYANEQGKPFLAVSGKHGGTLGLGKVSHGVGIWMHNLNGIEVAADGTTAKAGGGIVSKKFVHALWEQGK